MAATFSLVIHTTLDWDLQFQMNERSAARSAVAAAAEWEQEREQAPQSTMMMINHWIAFAGPVNHIRRDENMSHKHI